MVRSSSHHSSLLAQRCSKLGRVGAIPDAETFAVQLEKAIQRGGVNRIIDITPEEPLSEFAQRALSRSGVKVIEHSER